MSRACLMMDGLMVGRVVRVEPAVAVAHHGQVIERIEAPRVRFQLGQLHAGRRLRTRNVRLARPPARAATPSGRATSASAA